MSATTFLDYFIDELEAVEGASADVTLGALTLGAREATTGWLAITYPASTIKMPILPQGATFSFKGFGLHAFENALGITNDTVKLGDQIKASDNRYFTIVGLEKLYHLNKFIGWKATLKEQPMWEAVPGIITWAKTRDDDPRKNTKDFINTYCRATHITKDDDSAQAPFKILWKPIPYEIIHEFRPGEEDGVYLVGKPKTTSELGVRYTERVPIDIVTVDSTDVTGTVLNYKMEAELRYACNYYPHGSLRLSEMISEGEKIYGPTTLYITSFILYYRRTSAWGKA